MTQKLNEILIQKAQFSNQTTYQDSNPQVFHDFDSIPNTYSFVDNQIIQNNAQSCKYTSHELNFILSLFRQIHVEWDGTTCDQYEFEKQNLNDGKEGIHLDDHDEYSNPINMNLDDNYDIEENRNDERGSIRENSMQNDHRNAQNAQSGLHVALHTHVENVIRNGTQGVMQDNLQNTVQNNQQDAMHYTSDDANQFFEQETIHNQVQIQDKLQNDGMHAFRGEVENFEVTHNTLDPNQTHLSSSSKSNVTLSTPTQDSEVKHESSLMNDDTINEKDFQGSSSTFHFESNKSIARNGSQDAHNRIRIIEERELPPAKRRRESKPIFSSESVHRVPFHFQGFKFHLLHLTPGHTIWVTKNRDQVLICFNMRFFIYCVVYGNARFNRIETLLAQVHQQIATLKLKMGG